MTPRAARRTPYTYWLLKDKTYTTTDPATTGIDDSLYASTTDKYIKESFTEITSNNSTAGTTVSAFVDANGKLRFKGLGEGEYKIEETVVPAGYNKAADIEFIVSFDPDTQKFSTDNEKVKFGVNADGTATTYLTTEVENKSGTELPETGGIGTTMIYLFGAVMTVGAGVVLVTRRRMKSVNA